MGKIKADRIAYISYVGFNCPRHCDCVGLFACGGPKGTD